MYRCFWVIFVLFGSSTAFRKSTMITTGDFSLIINRHDFVDKTRFIKTVFEGPEQVLITAPHRSGKSTIADMLAKFVELEFNEEGIIVTKQRNSPVNDTANYKLFSGGMMRISKYKEVMNNYFGRYPLMRVDFKCIQKFRTSEESVFCFREIIHKTFVQHKYLRRSDQLTLKDKRLVKRWSYGNYDNIYGQDVTNSLYKLSIILYKHFGRRIFVVIDNYDFPSVSAMMDVKDSKELNRVVRFNMGIISKLLTGDYRYLERAVILGFSHVVAAGVYPMENVQAYKFLGDHPFVEYFGLTKTEVDELFRKDVFNLTKREIEKGHDYFNGYINPINKTIYSLYSVLKYVNEKILDSFYISTEFTKNLKWLFKIKTIRKHVETLVKGGIIEVKVNDVITLDDMINLRNAIFNLKIQEHFNINLIFYFLMEQGFLSYSQCNNLNSETALLNVPNEEIKLVLALKIKEYYDGIYRTDKTLLKKCASFIDKVSPSALVNGAHFKRALYWFYKSLEQLISGVGNRFGKINEDDVHRIIFSILYQGNTKSKDAFKISVNGTKRHLDILLVKEKFSVVMEFKVNSTSVSILDEKLKRIKNTKSFLKYQKYILFTIGVDHYLHLSVSCLSGISNLNQVINIP
ncbi:uncharacterized protein LOC124367617 [Homalodisca vitripennis]|uniref:uncharacterized protein LOC124367617 n=1 Tax=Homalodisca vitripennis TaxID=197043 RepID=UPI001EEC66BB|nr:uncharacterized protein LOC124367617 [Homalodisca vitripennis]